MDSLSFVPLKLRSDLEPGSPKTVFSGQRHFPVEGVYLGDITASRDSIFKLQLPLAISWRSKIHLLSEGKNPCNLYD